MIDDLIQLLAALRENKDSFRSPAAGAVKISLRLGKGGQAHQ
ncbi:hypothetical protein [Microvirga massiliensis]|nr:hypothetical protein [Microvirga massiliensis]